MRQVTEKAGEKVGKIRRLIPNIGRPSSDKTAVLSADMHSVLLYGELIWQHAIEILKHKVAMESCKRAQRRALIGVESAYRTVYTVALQVISETVSFHLQAAERKRI